MVESLSVRPDPPVVIITLIAEFFILSLKYCLISLVSSVIIFFSINLCPCSSIFFSNILPDLSVLIFLVSEIVAIDIPIEIKSFL